MNDLHPDTRYWLDQFNEQANYSSGNTNPHDYSRWVRFVFSAHEHGDDPGEEELREHFRSVGWDEQRAARLAREFRASIRLLPEYDKHLKDR